jgi:hypothetical protein
MGDYTNILNVSNELNGFSINNSSTPSDVTVLGWISEASSEIDNITGKKWDSNLVTNEVYDYDGGGSLLLNNSPIITIASLQFESSGLGGISESWTSLYEGRTSSYDFIVYKNEGEVVFHSSNKPVAGFQNVKITYSYGYSTTPLFIERLATLLVAKRLILSVQSGSATNEGGTVSVGTISVSDPSSFGGNHLKSINDEINMIYSSIGTLKTYRLSRRY